MCHTTGLVYYFIVTVFRSKYSDMKQEYIEYFRRYCSISVLYVVSEGSTNSDDFVIEIYIGSTIKLLEYFQAEAENI